FRLADCVVILRAASSGLFAVGFELPLRVRVDDAVALGRERDDLLCRLLLDLCALHLLGGGLGAHLLASFRAGYNFRLLLDRQLCERIQLGALVERGSDYVREVRNSLGACGIPRDVAFASACLASCVFRKRCQVGIFFAAPTCRAVLGFLVLPLIDRLSLGDVQGALRWRQFAASKVLVYLGEPEVIGRSLGREHIAAYGLPPELLGGS